MAPDTESAAASAARNPEPNICTTCGAMVREPNTYHPYAYCVLVKAKLDPEDVVHEAVRFYDKHGWPEATV